MRNVLLGVILPILLLSLSSESLVVLGLKVSCKGNTGHGSLLIENTAGEKLVCAINFTLY